MLCAQLIACTAEWIFPDDLYCFAKWMIYNATLVSEAGREVITGLKLLHHLQKVLKAYLYCFAVLSALDVIQYRGSSDASSSRRWSLHSLLMPIHLPSSNISEKCVCSNKTSISSYFQITTFLVYQDLHHLQYTLWCIRTIIHLQYINRSYSPHISKYHYY